MKKQTKLLRSLMTVALITVMILMIPFVAMQFTSEVDWSAADFLIMGVLIFGSGLTYVLINRFAPNWVYRIAITVAFYVCDGIRADNTNRYCFTFGNESISR